MPDHQALAIRLTNFDSTSAGKSRTLAAVILDRWVVRHRLLANIKDLAARGPGATAEGPTAAATLDADGQEDRRILHDQFLAIPRGVLL